MNDDLKDAKFNADQVAEVIANPFENCSNLVTKLEKHKIEVLHEKDVSNLYVELKNIDLKLRNAGIFLTNIYSSD